MNKDRTLSYYDDQAFAYYCQTREVNLEDIYHQFLDQLILDSSQTILDVGCGSGRDSIYFAKQAFDVTAIDGSGKLLNLAKENCQYNIDWRHLSFNDIAKQNWVNYFNGIWACSSLLHIPFNELPNILKILVTSLKKDGVIYMSFKYGNNERTDGKRLFCDMNENRINIILDEVSKLKLVKIWHSQDKRDLNSTIWFNILMTKNEMNF